MTIKATSEQHADRIFADLESKGYHYIMSCNYIQEWRKGNESIFILKGYK